MCFQQLFVVWLQRVKVNLIIVHLHSEHLLEEEKEEVEKHFINSQMN